MISGGVRAQCFEEQGLHVAAADNGHATLTVGLYDDDLVFVGIDAGKVSDLAAMCHHEGAEPACSGAAR